MYDSTKMTISLPIEKIKYIIVELLKKNKFTIRKFALVLGKLVAACPSLTYGRLYTKTWRQERQQNLDVMEVAMMKKCHCVCVCVVYSDIRWWLKHIPLATRSISNNNFAKEIFSDASLTGWGGFCKGDKTWILELCTKEQKYSLFKVNVRF